MQGGISLHHLWWEGESMERYEVEIVKGANGNKTIVVKGFVLSKELKAIKEKIGDVNQYRVGKKFVVYV